ncbi:hypothetical protein HNQ02_000657 [Flavobacterium sp. 7E]|uniref:hypothetical protein n=1 Tax=Flavobacterium sp. 7E TaxID=2735898 RepID=UPI0015707956|nr:hypothetical protein [Flavobacterium sp. 7E]NRS87750.1 hypothetical protein [Flavobacterium sp. 7E]
MNDLNLAKRQGDFFLCLSLSEDLNLSVFDAFIANKRDIKKNEIYCLNSEADSIEEGTIIINSPYRLINILFVSLNREGYESFIKIEENIELKPILSRLKKVIVFDGYPFQQLNMNFFIEALNENLLKSLIPISVGIVCDFKRNQDYDESEFRSSADRAFKNYEKQMGSAGVFKIEQKLLDDNLKFLVSRQLHPHITRHHRYLQSLKDLRSKNNMMLELFKLEFELFLTSLIQGFEIGKHDKHQMSFKIANEFLGVIDQNGLKDFQRESSYSSLTNKIHSDCKKIGTELTMFMQNKTVSNYKEIILNASHMVANEIHKQIENEIIFWTNEK